MQKPNSLDKLRKQLERVEKILEKHRAKCAELEPKWTMRRTRHEINWDFYAQQKMKLKEQIEIAEQQQYEDKTRENLYCISCQAMFELECCCEIDRQTDEQTKANVINFYKK